LGNRVIQHRLQNDRNKAHSVILSILCFFISLQSYYFYQVALPLLSIAGLVLLGTYLICKPGVKKIAMAPFIITSFFYIYLYEVSAFRFLTLEHNINLKDILRYMTMILAAFFFSLIKKEQLSGVTRTTLMLHISFFYLQLLSYYVFDLNFDYLAPITGEAQRVGTAHYTITGSPLYRATGLFNEPGTYSNFCAVITAMFLIFPENRSRKLIIFLSILSLFLSFSVYGFIFGLALLFFIKGNLAKTFKILMYVGCIVATVFLYQRFFLSSLTSETGVGLRTSFIIELVGYLSSDVGNFLFGTGLLHNYNPLSIDFPFNDASLIIYILFTTGFLGLVGLAPLAIIIFRFRRAVFTKLTFVILLFSKISIFAPFFALILIVILKSRGVCQEIPTGKGRPLTASYC
jgi:hypothetical protein